MTHPVKAPRKLIEVALPLDAINVAAAREKSIRHSHPSTLHLYWARRPLAAARAVIFAQMVNDPSWRWEMEHAGEVPPNNLKATWAKSRKRLFGIIEELVKWENTSNEAVLEKARAEIQKSWSETCEINADHPRAAELFDPAKLPVFHDPFAGGGSIPLEAQRLGLEAHASDLNPLAVLLNKAMLEIPPRFSGRPPVSADARSQQALMDRSWIRSQGLAEDVRFYGQWMRDEAQKRIGHLYPKILVTDAMVKERADLKQYVGQRLTAIVWIWARTVRSPNPAFAHIDVPLASTFMLSTKAGKEAYVEPILDSTGYRFTVKLGKPRDPAKAKTGTKLARGANFQCLMSATPIAGDYIKSEGRAGRMGARLMAVLAEGERGRVYLTPTPEMEALAQNVTPEWKPDTPLAPDPRALWTPPYGLATFGDLFTARQLVALTTFSDLVSEARDRVFQDAIAAGLRDDGVALREGGTEAESYADAVAVYLGLGVGRSANYWSSLTPWGGEFIVQTFGRQAIPMVWDYAEGNPFSSSTGNWTGALEWIEKVIANTLPASVDAYVSQADAQTQELSVDRVVSTDPPYYDNVGYADLSDYFYVWLRRSIRSIYPDLFATLAVPKAEELVATPYRHGSKEKAEAFFLGGMTHAMQRLASQAHPAFPVTIYYAFKQSESESEVGTVSTGWETFLDAVIRAGFALDGTWPMRTERDQGLKTGTNVLASSIILVCRRRGDEATTTSRRHFTRELSRVLPEALDAMTRGADDRAAPVAPVDLSQAIIGPGMEVFSRYSAVLEADGSPMTVRTALTLINRYLADDDFDADTQFCLAWFEQHGWKSGPFGSADVLARAKGTSVEGARSAGVVNAAGGSVRLMRPSEYTESWDPASDDRVPVWEVLHHLIRALRDEGETGASALLSAVQGRAESARQLAYRLYSLCERAGWAEDARAYNELVTSWTAIEVAAAAAPAALQPTLFDA
jgi:putative DNA methylase